MKHLYRLCMTAAVWLGIQHLSLAQQPVNLGTTSTFLNDLNAQVKTAANQRAGKRVIKAQTSPSDNLNLIVNFQKSENKSHQYVVGSIENKEESSFFIEVKNKTLEGNILLKKEEKAFKYYSDQNGNAFISEVDIHDLICINLDHAPEAQGAEAPSAAAISQAMLNLQSFPGAAGCVLLDFDGYYMPAGNLWNQGNAINAAHSGMSDAAVLEHWELVSEDFRPFNLNITTNEAVYNAYPKNRRMRCVVTPTNTAAPGAGGVAYINSFGWNNDVPCWVFITSGKAGGEASSHEIGHTFGLGHDGRHNPQEGYFAGHGDWSTIMGVGYYKNITQWSRGEYNQANNQEDDLAKIASSNFGVGYRTDDHGNATGSATNLVYNASGTVSASQNKGIIERTADLDFFSFTTSGGTITLNINTVSRHGNLDILARLYNASGTQIGSYNPSGLNASISTNLSAGRYFLSVTGTGSGNPATNGYSNYASIGSYTIAGHIPPAANNPANGVITVYKDCFYNGYAVALEEGDYTLSQLQARGILNDDISSLRVQYGYKVTAYLDDNFQGGSLVINADDDCLVNENFNDKISSLRIRPDGVTGLNGTFHLQNRHSNLYVDLSGGNTADGADIVQWNFNGGQNQQYVLSDLGNGVYKITNVRSGKALDVKEISNNNGAFIHQWTYKGADNQKFIIKATNNGYYKLIAKHSGKIVEIGNSSTSTGTKLQQWTNHAQNSGQWKLVPVSNQPPAFTHTIQAENYSAMEGVQTEPTTDTGGGLNVGYIDNGDWMAYNNIQFPTSGTYKVEYRVASMSGGQLSLDLNAGTIQLGVINVPATNGWQNWTTISHNVNVNAGTYALGIYAQTGGWNINWIRITRTSNIEMPEAAIAATADLVASGSADATALELYPNPTEHTLALNTNYDLAGSVLKIFDATGGLVYEAINPSYVIPVSQLGQGMYTLMLITKDESKIVRRFIKR
jgi:hypothetical protein